MRKIMGIELTVKEVMGDIHVFFNGNYVGKVTPTLAGGITSPEHYVNFRDHDIGWPAVFDKDEIEMAVYNHLLTHSY
jgi:hypothetical protein